MYRGQSGMWAWLIHRITGIGVLLFLIVHIVDISLLNPLYDRDRHSDHVPTGRGKPRPSLPEIG
jgi:succinate dehydrogenase/fumarate reductase cytochrome b subunit